MQGWIKLFEAKHWHYFTKDGYSLCKKWLIFSLPAVTDQKDDAPDNCEQCRKLKALND